MMTKLEMTISAGSTVRYWSVYRQTWAQSSACLVPARELAAMSLEERERILDAVDVQIRALRDESARDGDEQTRGICARALSGDDNAREQAIDLVMAEHQADMDLV